MLMEIPSWVRLEIFGILFVQTSHYPFLTTLYYHSASVEEMVVCVCVCVRACVHARMCAHMCLCFFVADHLILKAFSISSLGIFSLSRRRKKLVAVTLGILSFKEMTV